MEQAFLYIEQFLSTLVQNPLFGLSVILLGGYLLGSVSEKIHLPEITGFILAGLIAGPHALGIIQAGVKGELQLLTELALSIIAFTVGSNLRAAILARVARPVLLMALGHLTIAFVFVASGLYIAGLPASIAILMGVLAGGSSPGTVVAIVQHERAHGVFVEQLYGVVAVATAVTITLFGLVYSFLPMILGATENDANTVGSTLVAALGDTGMSVLIGGVAGFVLHLITRNSRGQAQTSLLTFAVLILSTSVALTWHLSTLLLNMTIGVVYINLSRQPMRVLESIRSWSPPLYAVFFVLAGAKLNPNILTNLSILLFGLVYIATRIAGSYLGTSLGARIGGAEPTTARFLPLCLVPQAGVALGLILVLEDSPVLDVVSPAMAANLTQTITIMLLAILVKEIVGPPISTAAIRRGADIAKE